MIVVITLLITTCPVVVLLSCTLASVDHAQHLNRLSLPARSRARNSDG